METVCPFCDNFLDVMDELEGTRTRCEFCGQIFTVDPVFVLDMAKADGPTVRIGGASMGDAG
jgi:hypothetical protein